MLVLGIETTCDETAVGIVRLRPGAVGAMGGEVIGHQLFSQIAEHSPYGGVVPELAARSHINTLVPLIELCLRQAGIPMDSLDGFAAAAGPGLIGGILVGLTTAKALALVAQKKFIAINHLEAHALTVRLQESVSFPYLLLLISGGHTQILAVLGVGQYVRLGGTLDDSIGEAFDKTARLLSLPYPGGPKIEECALNRDANRFSFPRPLLGRKTADFSLSGLKTAVRIEVERLGSLSEKDVGDICASFQNAVMDIVIDRLRVGLSLFMNRFRAPSALVVAGGVAANRSLRRILGRFAAQSGLRLLLPPPHLCTDNGVMIAWAGVERLRLGLTDNLDFPAHPRWPLEQYKNKH